VRTYSSGTSGLALLAGLGAFVGIAYLLTRKEAAAATTPAPNTPPASLPAPVPAPVTTSVAPQTTLRAVQALQTVPVATPPTPQVRLDPSLTAAEIEAVTYALARETDPQKLLGFADSWGSMAPITSALLTSKAAVLSKVGT